MKKLLIKLKEKKEFLNYHFRPLAKEGSNKEFYRLSKKKGPESSILMLANDKDKAKGTLKDWIQIAKALTSVGVRIPKVQQFFTEENAILMEDCQDTLLTDKLNELYSQQKLELIKQHYLSTLKLLKATQGLDSKLLKYTLGNKTLYNDLLFFYHEHIKKRITEHSSFWNKDLFLEEAQSLSLYLNSLERTFTHRDFHSRNLLLSNNELVLIDFQDACLGPRAYDLISLTFDPYVLLPIEQKKDLFSLGLEFIQEGLREKKRKELLDSWKAVAIQRLYKVLGSYNFLGAQKGKEKFLQHIKPTLGTLSQLDLFDSRWPYLTQKLKEGVISLEA